MSNIHSPSAHHGVDDEFNYGQPDRCLLCWARAKRAFFDTPRRRGVTLDKTYRQLFLAAHSNGNSH